MVNVQQLYGSTWLLGGSRLPSSTVATLGLKPVNATAVACRWWPTAAAAGPQAHTVRLLGGSSKILGDYRDTGGREGARRRWC